MQRATASDVSKVKPIGAVSWNSCRPRSLVPGGALGCTSTGSSRRSISFQIVGESLVGQRAAVDVGEHHDADGAVIARTLQLIQRELAMLPGQRREPADAVRATASARRAMSSFMMRAALRLTSGLPQNTFGQVSEVMAMSTRALFMFAMRASQSNMFGTGVMKGEPSRWIAFRPPATSFSV